MPPRRARLPRATLPRASPDAVPRASSLARDLPGAERPRPDPRRALADPRVRTARASPRVRSSLLLGIHARKTRTFSSWGSRDEALDPRFDVRTDERTRTRLSKSILSGRTATRTRMKGDGGNFPAITRRPGSTNQKSFCQVCCQSNRLTRERNRENIRGKPKKAVRNGGLLTQAGRSVAENSRAEPKPLNFIFLRAGCRTRARTHHTTARAKSRRVERAVHAANRAPKRAESERGGTRDSRRPEVGDR